MEHKHADLIRAWAGGAKIQKRTKGFKRWKDTDRPLWDEDTEYRIKADQYIWEAHMKFERNEVVAMLSKRPNLRLTFDVNTNKLLSAEVLK